MKKKLLLLIVLCVFCVAYFFTNVTKTETSNATISSIKVENASKKSIEEKQMTIEQRVQFEFDMQKNPSSGFIPREEKEQELLNAINERNRIAASRDFSSNYVPRGPSNLGGRTRAVAFDISDNTGNTMLAGGVSSGMFRTTDGGANWVKVSSNDELYNVTAIAQDPRAGFQNIWYYGTGELLGNSARLGTAIYRGQGIWRSDDSGLTWNQIPTTNSVYESFDSPFDYVQSLAVSPITGELFVAAFGTIYRYDGANFNVELQNTSSSGDTDVKVTSSGRVYVAFSGNNPLQGVYTSPTGNGGFTAIAQNGTPALPANGDPVGWSSQGRRVLAIAPSNENIVYALFTNGQSGSGNNPMVEADLWRYNLATDTWTDFTSKLPDEPGDDSPGNDPFAIQGGYDLEVAVRPDNENFVVIGGTNVYSIGNISVSAQFNRIGGYRNNSGYAKYDLGTNADVHHPDIHDLVFNPFNANMLYSGTDGGVHSADVNGLPVGWTNLNNNYQTYQYYHVGLDPQAGTNFVIGGAQDNGTTLGGAGSIAGVPNNTVMNDFFSGDGAAVAIGRTGTNINTTDIQLYFTTQLGRFFTLRNNGFIDIQPDPTTVDPNNSIFVTYFYLDTDTNSMYYADGNIIYRTLDAPTVTSSTWTNIGNLSSFENIRSITSTRGVYNPTSSYTLVGGENGGVFRHDDPRGTNLSGAVNITPAGASTASNSIVSGVAIHPTNPDIAMVVYSNYGINNIYITNNVTSNSPTWTLVERNLSSHSIRSAAIAEIDGDIGYFVGTARGLYRSLDPTTTDWQLEGADQLGLSLISSLVYRPSDNVLLVGTHGSGMFQASFTTLSTSENSIDEKAIAMYPNPATNKVTLAYSGLEQLQSASVSDINGKLVMQVDLENFNQSKELDINQLVSGIYFVKILDVKGSSSVKKLIVN